MLVAACAVFATAGVLAISGVVAFIVFLVLDNYSGFSAVDSESYVQDPLGVTVVAFIVAFVVAVGFMMVFDQVADTLLYCFVIEKDDSGYNNHAPEPLHRLLENV